MTIFGRSQKPERSASVEHGGVTWRIDVFASRDVELFAGDELIAYCRMAGGIVWLHGDVPNGWNEEAVTSLEAALAARDTP